MKPVSTHTMSRLVWISLLTSNGKQSRDRIGPEVLRDREEAEHHLQAVEQEGHHEVGVGDGLGAIAHVRSSYFRVMR